MKRLMTGFGMAAAFGLVASLSAQTTTTSATQSTSDRDREVTITGCLERGTNGNYTLTNARADNDRSPDHHRMQTCERPVRTAFQ